MNKSKLEKEIKLLKEEIVDLKIQKHTKHYIHIPWDWNVIGRIAAFLGSGALSVLSFFVLLAAWKQLNIDTVFADKPAYLGAYQFGIIPMMLFEYVAIGLTAVYFVALVKGGFDRLKPWDDGIIAGLILGLIAGLIGGIIVELIFGLIVGLILGLIGGLILGLIVGLIFGLIVGLGKEFE